MTKLSVFRYYLILQLVLVSASLFSQQVPVYTMQDLIKPSINPAYIGLDEIYDMVLLTRQQWVGFEGAPRSFYLGTNVPLRNRKTGLGFDIQHNSVGPLSQNGAFIGYSYRVNISERSTISFGLRGGINIYRIGLRDLLVIDPGDYLFENDVENRVLPNFGTGVHYKINNYYLDFSIPMLLSNDLNPKGMENIREENREVRNYIIQAGTEYKLTQGFYLSPSLGLWLAKDVPPLIDIRLSANFQDVARVGIAYRVEGSLSFHFTYKILGNFLLGYAYELPLSYNYQLSSGTHEIVIAFNFQLIKKKTLSPRRY